MIVQTGRVHHRSADPKNSRNVLLIVGVNDVRIMDRTHLKLLVIRHCPAPGKRTAGRCRADASYRIDAQRSLRLIGRERTERRDFVLARNVTSETANFAATGERRDKVLVNGDGCKAIEPALLLDGDG